MSCLQKISSFQKNTEVIMENVLANQNNLCLAMALFMNKITYKSLQTNCKTDNTKQTLDDQPGQRPSVHSSSCCEGICTLELAPSPQNRAFPTSSSHLWFPNGLQNWTLNCHHTDSLCYTNSAWMVTTMISLVLSCDNPCPPSLPRI